MVIFSIPFFVLFANPFNNSSLILISARNFRVYKIPGETVGAGGTKQKNSNDLND